MKKSTIITLITLVILAACQNIETGDSLDKGIISLIKEMGLLDEDETIILYYSNYEKDKAGNFFTDKRIAHYWLDQDDSKTDISFAYYEDIVSIDTIFNVHDTYIPYMTVTKRDSSTFRVFIEGTYQQEKDFFNQAIHLWKKKTEKKSN